MIGLLLGSFQSGLLAGIGGFTYLYVFNEPYAERAKKLFFVLIGLSLSVGLGTLFAPRPYLLAIVVGLIGAIVTFIFGALKIPGPAAVFFILGFTLVTSMPVDPDQALTRAFLVFLGGSLSWVIGMAGWLFTPEGPEKDAVKKVYLELANLIESVGTKKFDEARQSIVLQMKQAEEILLSGYISWRSSDFYKRLFLLNDHANKLFLHILHLNSTQNKKLPTELSASVRAIAQSIHNKKSILVVVQQPEQMEDSVNHLFSEIYDADAILNEPVTKVNRELKISKRTIKTVFLGAFDKNSIVFITAIRNGLFICIAALIANSFEFSRSYWIPLTCSAVMLGATILTTFHRAIQRTVGTIIGVIVAVFILSLSPEAWVIILIMFTLTILTELFIVRNYAIAVLFITQNAILMAENSSQMHAPTLFASARIIDIMIGSALGLFGTLLVGRRSASSRLPHMMVKTIRSQMQLLLMLFSEQGSDYVSAEVRGRNKMHTNLTDLRLFYSTALGEFPKNKAVLQSLWPVIFSIIQLGYLLDSCSKQFGRSILSDEHLARMLLVSEKMAMSIEQEQTHIRKGVPEIPGFPAIQKEIMALQEALEIFQREKKLAISEQ